MPSAAFAWGDVGHRVICQIAYEELKPEIKARVDALVAIDPRFRTFADGCTWPDVFPRQRAPEHYVDLSRSAKGIEVAHPCPVADRCVVSAILNDMRDLALSLDVSDQLRLLESLGHWVGDVHQPLHVSFDDDRSVDRNSKIRRSRLSAKSPPLPCWGDTQGTISAVFRIAPNLTPAILRRSRTVAACAVR